MATQQNGNRIDTKQIDAAQLLRAFADRALSRTAGAPLVTGNSVRLLRDAAENYPAWIAAIKAARRTIHFESYIIHEDETGREFAELLKERRREGVTVRLLYDWMGALSSASNSFWRDLRRAGIEVRCFNPPRFDSPLGWLGRDHRKMIAVDGEVGFVTGLCVGKDWVGDPSRKKEPWRDTGVEVRGPAVADIEAAFAQTWGATGKPLPEDVLPAREEIERAGDTALRVVATVPNTAGMYRLDLLIAAIARRRLWLTDAYFVATDSYIQALRSAARDGVDVRLLVPGGSDIPVVRALSHTSYRALLEGGVRVYEWNGSMLHAKTAVADHRWARVGSTNLNLSSWIGNWELDVTVEDGEFANQMAEMYERDLEHSTEIVLTSKQRVRAADQPEPRQPRAIGGGSVGRAASGAITVGGAVRAAVMNRRPLGAAEVNIMLAAGGVLLVLSVLAVWYPRVVTVPLALFAAWIAVSLFLKSYKLWRADKDELRAGKSSQSASPDLLADVSGNTSGTESRSRELIAEAGEK